MEEGGCDDMACDGEQVVTISGYEDVAANDEQALLKASGRHFQFYSGVHTRNHYQSRSIQPPLQCSACPHGGGRRACHA
jgi:hypothetical protein